MRPALSSWWRVGLLLSFAAAVSTSVVAGEPQGPRVVVSPEPGKPPDMFAAEADFCRSDAESTISDDSGGGGVVRSAVIGTVLGAAAGALLSGRHHDNTAVGAVTGLVMGTAAGAGRQAQSDEQAQRRYDAAYEQCMVAKGNGAPQRVVYRQAVPRYQPPVTAPPQDFPPPGMPQSYPPPPPPQR